MLYSTHITYIFTSLCSHVTMVTPLFVLSSSGYYSLEAASNCTICPAGHDCTDKASSPTPCLSGTASPEGDIGCYSCTPGMYLYVIYSRRRKKM